MSTKSVTVISLCVAVIFVGLLLINVDKTDNHASFLGSFGNWFLKFFNRPALKQKVCTTEAKVCPGGSTVSRVGPNCEFAPCPSTCVDKCKDGKCDEVVCQATGCPCAETPASCPQDCKSGNAIQPPAQPPASCLNKCGDGLCQKIVCLATGCPCAETPASCPQDCKNTKSSQPPAIPQTCVNKCGNGTCEQVVCTALGCPCAETSSSCPTDCPNVLPGGQARCATFWWRDNEHPTCQQKEFCGLYMYYGLKTYSTREECLRAANQ